jgi:DNA-binding transcriptional LysR family regulator
MSPTIGVKHILPLLPPFIEKYPRVRPEWHFENRPVDLIAENYDAAIGGGFDLDPGFVSRTLAPVHIVAVASPAYMAGRKPPTDPSELAAYSGIVMRAQRTGRVRHWMFRNVKGVEMAGTLDESVVMDDPIAMREAALLGLGISVIALFDVLPELERGDLIRLLPDWYADAGAISIYYASRKFISAKTRVFVDCVVNGFKSKRLDVAFSANHS